MFDYLVERGYRVIPQVPVGQYRIDMVVEGDNDARLAIECDGDRFHGPEQWDSDMRRQRILEREGWIFWRSFASTFVTHRDEVLADLLDTLERLGIRAMTGSQEVQSIHTEYREIVEEPVLGVEDPKREGEDPYQTCHGFLFNAAGVEASSMSAPAIPD